MNGNECGEERTSPTTNGEVEVLGTPENSRVRTWPSRPPESRRQRKGVVAKTPLRTGFRSSRVYVDDTETGKRVRSVRSGTGRLAPFSFGGRRAGFPLHSPRLKRRPGHVSSEIVDGVQGR